MAGDQVADRVDEEANSEANDDDGRRKRTGTLFTASAHIITAVIGSGVLTLAWATAQLGWVAGPANLIVFSAITYMASTMLADCYRSPGPVVGTRNHTYSDAVQSFLGGMNVNLCRTVQYALCAGNSIGYSLTAANSTKAILKANCYHKHGHDAKCPTTHYYYVVGFGVIQLVLSQLPNFHEISWLSAVAALMSFSYSIIGFALSLAKLISGGGAVAKTSLTGTQIGVHVGTRADKVWKVFQAVGDMAFAYAFSSVLVEIQDTLKSEPPENKVMKKATSIGIATTTVFYLLCGCVGYAAFGNDAPGNFLTDFGFYEPFWLVDFANLCVVVHMIGAYQVFSQPVFAFFEHNCQRKWPDKDLINANQEGKIKVPYAGIGVPYNVNVFRLIYRTAYVVLTVLIALVFPFFNSFLGLLGAVSFFPLTVYFPVQMHIVQNKIEKWSFKWVMLNLVLLFCLLVSLAAGVGSVQGLASSVGKYKLFSSADD